MGVGVPTNTLAFGVTRIPVHNEGDAGMCLSGGMFVS